MTNPRKIYLLFFLALTLCYLSLSPGAILGMGYTAENVSAAEQLISGLGDWFRLRPASPVTWPRHGLYELIFQVPFLLASRLFFGPSTLWLDGVLAVEPILATALLCTLIFVWVHRITASLVWGYVLAVVAGLSTMLWPYAYIGLETTQSLFLLLSGYLALGSGRRRSWPSALLFAVSCGLAVSLKSNGIFLAPAVCALIYFYFRDELAEQAARPGRAWGRLALIVLIAGGLYLLNAYIRTLSPVWSSGALSFFKRANADGPLVLMLNALSFLGSVNKGLIMYAPVTLLCLAAFPRAYRASPRVAVFVGLTLAGLVGGCSLFYFWSEETWGPRYLHSAVGPLVICLAVTRQAVRFRLRREAPLIALAVWGLAVSFLGAVYYYGVLHVVAMRSSQSTIEALQSDPRWNHIRFNLKLLGVWASGTQSPGGEAEAWPPPPHWWFEQPPDAPPLKTVNLREFATPQPSLVRAWRVPQSHPHQIVWYLRLGCLCFGPLLLAWLWRLVARRDPALHQKEPQLASESRASHR